MRNWYTRRMRIGAPDVDFEGVYEFYKMLERRERKMYQGRLLKIAMAVSVPVMFVMTAYCASHYVDWSPVTHVAQSFNNLL